MDTGRVPARLVGALFILASASAIVGTLMYVPALQDLGLLSIGAEVGHQIRLGALSELVLVCSAVGTAVLLFPVLRRQHEGLALGYVAFRLLEAVFILIGLLSLLTLSTVGTGSGEATGVVAPAVQASRQLLISLHRWTFILGPNLMLGVNTLLCAVLLYTAKLVPRFISGLGIVGAVLVFAAALLELFGVIEQLSLWGVGLALPVATYEMLLAGWLIVKGLRSPAPAAEIAGKPAPAAPALNTV